MASEFQLRRRVEFVETDMPGIVHFSNFFRWMEQTEHAFFRSLDLSLHAQGKERMFGFARVHASCDYEKPLHYTDEVEVRLRVVGKTSATFTYELEFWRVLPGEAGAPEELVRAATGRMKVCCVSKEGLERMRATEMPAAIADAIELAPQAV